MKGKTESCADPKTRLFLNDLLRYVCHKKVCEQPLSFGFSCARFWT